MQSQHEQEEGTRLDDAKEGSHSRNDNPRLFITGFANYTSSHCLLEIPTACINTSPELKIFEPSIQPSSPLLLPPLHLSKLESSSFGERM